MNPFSIKIAFVRESKALYTFKILQDLLCELYILQPRVYQVLASHKHYICNVSSSSKYNIYKRFYNTLIFGLLVYRTAVVQAIILGWQSFNRYANQVVVVKSILVNNFVNIGFLTQIKDSILAILLNRHPKIVAIQPKVYYLKLVPKGPLNSLNLYNAQPNNQEVVNIYCNIYITLDKDTKVSINQFKAKALQKVCKHLVLDIKSLL